MLPMLADTLASIFDLTQPLLLVSVQDPGARWMMAREAAMRREARDCDDILAATQAEAFEPAPADANVPISAPAAGAVIYTKASQAAQA